VLCKAVTTGFSRSQVLAKATFDRLKTKGLQLKKCELDKGRHQVMTKVHMTLWGRCAKKRKGCNLIDKMG